MAKRIIGERKITVFHDKREKENNWKKL